MEEKWQAFLDQLQQLFPDAPKVFNAGASESELQAFEQALGWNLPEVTREWFSVVNGQRIGSASGPILTFHLMSLNEILYTIEIFKETSKIPYFPIPEPLESSPKGYIREEFICERWLPIAENYGSGYLIMDLQPDTLGVPGQIFTFDYDFGMRCLLALSPQDLVVWVGELFADSTMSLEKDEFWMSIFRYKNLEIGFLDIAREMAMDGSLIPILAKSHLFKNRPTVSRERFLKLLEGVPDVEPEARDRL
jgi:cell wall assembly regulator SMI1